MMLLSFDEWLEVVGLVFLVTGVAMGLIGLINSDWWCKIADKIL